MKKEDFVFFCNFVMVDYVFTGGFINGCMTAERYKTSAVKAGVGERIVDEDGNVEFKWKIKE